MSDGQIKTATNGPYVVRGVPLVRADKVETDAGEPIDWDVTEPYDPGDTYRLCRCGQSSNKPFCDDSHADADFDGSETGPSDAYADRAKTLGGTAVTVKDDRGICAHAGYCANQITNVWKAAKKIDDDPELRAQIVEMVKRCPSGALTVEADGAADEPDIPMRIAVQKDGPLLVQGGVPISRADGQECEVRNRVALCRCGQSSNKPFCDGSHKDAGFTG